MSAFSFGSAPKLPSWASGRSVKTEAPTDAGNPSANDAADGGTGARGPTAEGGVASRAKPGSTTAQGTVVPATLKAGEYTVRVHVLEGQRFVSESGTINALVEVGIDGVGTAGSVQTLPVAKSAVMPVWDQELIFGLECSAKEANNAQISIAVYDVLGPTSLLGFNRLIGRWHVELAHVYAHEGHEIYKDWIALELLEEGIGARGLLKLTVQVLGDGDVPREHAAGDDGVDAATAMHRLAAAVREPWCLVARVHRAHNIVKTDLTGHADPFVELRRGGETVRTSTIKSTPSPVWEQQIELPFVEPTPLQEAQLSLNDHDSLNMLHGNDVIGTQTIELDKLAVGTREPPEDAEPRWVHLYGAQQGVEGEIAAAMNEGRMEGYHYRGSLLVTIWKRRGAGGEQDTRTRSDVLPLAGDLKRQKGKVSVRRGSTPGSSLSAPPGVNRLLAPLRPKSRRLLNVPKHLKRSAAPLTQPPPDAKYELRVWLLKAVEVAVDSNASVEVEIGGHALEFHAKDPSRGMATWREKQRLTAELPSEPAALPDVCVYVRRKLGAFENTAERAAAAMGFDKGEAPRTTERVGCARLPAAALIKACEEHRAAHPEWVPLRWLLLLRDHSIDEIHSELAAYVQIGIELGRVDALAKVAFNDVPQPKMQARLLVGRFYLGRSLPPPQPNPHERLSGLLSLRSADEVDPFAVMHCHGGHVRSSTKQKTRNPRWYEEHSTLVQLPKKDHLAPLILLTVHDYALFGTHNSTVAHAFLNVPDVRVRSLEALDTALPEWVPLSSMNGEPLDEDAGVLMTVALVPMDEAPSPPRPVRIALDAVPVVVELIVFGCRHLRPMGGLGMSMRATYVEADLGDQATRAATRHARKQPANPTFVEVLNIRSKLAKPAILAPRLNLRVRSARPGPLEDALVGVAYIDLGSRLPWVDAGANGAAEAGADADAPPPKLDTRGLIAWLTKLRDLRDRLFGRDAHDEPPSALAGRALETLALGIMPTAPAEGGAGRAGRPPRLASCDGTEQLTASNTKLIVDKKEPKGLGRLQKSIDLTTSVLGEPPRKGKLRKPEPSYSYAVLDGSDGGYVPVPDEIRREYLVGRESFAEPLEAQLPRALFERWDLSALAAPSVFGTSSHTHREKVGVCKGILRVYERDPTAEDEETDETPSESESDAEEGQELDEEQAERAIAAAAVRATRRSRRSAVVRVRRERSMEERRTEMRELATITPLIHRALRAREVVVRVYVLSAQDLLPADSDGLADPYVVVSLGDDKVGSADWREENTREPHFFRCFELTASLPGDSQLMIMIYDWDLLSIGGAQLMGSTTIDIEDRLMSVEWLQERKKPIERRWLRHPRYDASMYRGSVDLWVDVLDARTAARLPPLNIAPPAPEPFELRLIVWRTRYIPNLDAEQSDQYVRCRLQLGGGRKRQEESTDVHYFARRGKASFNYRMTFDVTLPDDAEAASLIVTVLDFDLLTRDDVGGTAKLDLRNMFAQAHQQLDQLTADERALTFPLLTPEMLEAEKQRAADAAGGGAGGKIKRGLTFWRKPATGEAPPPSADRPDEERGEGAGAGGGGGDLDYPADGAEDGLRWQTQRFWCKLSPPAGQDPETFEGEVELSIQLLPKSVADKYPAGRTGRDEPNTNPVLPEPARPPALRMLYLGCQALWDEVNAIVPVEKLLCTVFCCACCGFLFFIASHYGLLIYSAARRARDEGETLGEEVEEIAEGE